MHVRKFNGDTLEETLSQIKSELGPDAIILKTVTNKGLKGAFKKNRIEITAAISEKNYVKKANVDQVLSNDQQETFYKGNASYISNMIDNHSDSSDRVKGNYGNIALNKTVQKVNLAEKQASPLDAFLSTPSAPSKKNKTQVREPEIPIQEIDVRKAAPEKKISMEEFMDHDISVAESRNSQSVDYSLIEEKFGLKIDELEKKIFDLTNQISQVGNQEFVGVRQLRSVLKSLDIDDSFIQHAILEVSRELPTENLENSDTVFEYVLKIMADAINTDLPLFSKTDVEELPIVTVLISESSVGQTTTMLKLGSLLEDSSLISYSEKKKKGHIAQELYSMDVKDVTNISEMVMECRKSVNEKKSVIIDYCNSSIEKNEIKKVIDGLRRSFENVEVLITLSSIHSEMYNMKVVNTLKPFADGMIFTHLDLCMNFGSLFNICSKLKNLPLKFFSTGEVVPDDLEGATKERILAGIFQL